MENTALDLIDKLIRSWHDWHPNKDDYLDKLAHAIVQDSGVGALTADEQEIVRQLRGTLSDEKWKRLPELIKERRAGRREEIASDRKRLAQQRARRQADEARRRQDEEQRARQQADEARRRQDEEQRARQQADEARRRQDEKQRARQQALIDRTRSAFASDFLSADKRLQCDPDRGLLSDAEYLELKFQFIQEWAKRVLHQPLDVQQAKAVAAAGGDVQVVARAGAGKTRTLVTRALFLQKHCGVSPRDLLLLAFNRAAACEMRERLGRELQGDVPHVMTFHALAYALVDPDEELVYDEPSAGSLGLSHEIQRVIDAHLQSEQHRPLIRDLMLMHFRDDWERIVEGGFHLPLDELIRYRSALPRETLKGEYVKSFGERLIANTLFQHDIDYKYERNFRWNGVNYKPDFSILLPNHRGVVIEYFGLKGNPDYDQMSAQKRRFWDAREGWTFLEFSPPDITSRGIEGFAAFLLERLRDAGVTGHRLSDAEIWERIRRRAVDTFTDAVRSFVSRCRKRNLGADDLRHMIDQHRSITEAEQLFLEVGASICTGVSAAACILSQRGFRRTHVAGCCASRGWSEPLCTGQRTRARRSAEPALRPD